MNSQQFQLDALPDFAPMREALQKAEFNASAIASTLAITHPAESIDVPVVLRRTEAGSPFHTLMRLFILEQVVPESGAREALLPMSLERLFECGLLQRTADGVRSMAKLTPYDDLFFASDFSNKERREPLPADFILGVGPASVSLASLTVRREVESVFDLGAGAGVQSLLASRHAKKVVGTDTNPRALNFAQFNARFNGIKNIEWRLGSFFEPVETELFDLVAANPPFVISPQSSLLYRDGGGEGDSVSEHVARGSAKRLKEGGFACMLINWHHRNAEDWSSRPLQWLTGNGCDAWLIRFSEYDPLTYAGNWLRQTEGYDPRRYSELLGEWTQYYSEKGIGRLSAGAVILRKRGGAKNWLRHDSMQSTQAGGPCSEHILRVFAAEDFLQSIESDEQVLNLRCVAHADVSIHQRLSLREGKWASQELAMNLSRGFPFPGHADPQVVQLLANCTGRRNIREIVQILAEEAKTSFASLAPTCATVVKKLIRTGMLTPVAPHG